MLERCTTFGGDWLNNANKTSKLQISSLSYQFTPNHIAKFESIYPSRDEVLDYMKKVIDYYGINDFCKYNCQLLNHKTLENGRVEITYQNLVDNEHHIIEVDHLIYTDSGLGDKIHEVNYEGENKFAGKIDYGVGDKICKNDFTGKDVVIIGMGAFAIENMRTAYENNAKSITILARSIKSVMSRSQAFGVCETSYKLLDLDNDVLEDLEDQEDFIYLQQYIQTPKIKQWLKTNYSKDNYNT